MRNLRQLVLILLTAGLAAAQPALHLKSLKRTTDMRVRAPGGAPLKARTLGRSHVLVQFANAPGDDQLRELANRGARVLSYVPDFALAISGADDISFEGLNVQLVGRLLPEEKISPELLKGALNSGTPVHAVIEFYADVDPNDARAIVNAEGLVIQDNPDLLANHLLVRGGGDQLRALAEWDEVSYVFPASEDLIRGKAVRACAGGMTKHGLVAQAVAIVDQGWAPGGSANLKYAFVNLTQQLPADSVESEIVRALNEWAKYAQLTFSPTTNFTDDKTIAVLFASGAHGDGYPFTGPGGVLAHTFYPVPTNPEPIAGDMHFNNDETWKIGADVDVFSIALHETGHALGLGHSDNPNDVMYPYYRMHSTLNTGDISAVLQLYAAQNGVSNPNPSPAPVPQTPLVLSVQALPSSTTASSVSISGTTSGGSGLGQVSWSTNQGGSGVAQGWPQFAAAVPLSLGLNTINIQATDSLQNRVSQNVGITRQQVSQPNPTPANPPVNNPAPPKPPSGPDTTPPSLNILSPASTSVYTSGTSIVVSGTASDNVGVASMTWSSSTGASGTATGTNQWTTPAIPLYIGTTTIIIRAYDAAGNTSWRSFTVTRH